MDVSQNSQGKGFVDTVIKNDLMAEFAMFASRANVAIANALEDFEKVPEGVSSRIGLKARSEQACMNETAEGEDSALESAETEVGEDLDIRGQETTNEPVDPAEKERDEAVKALREKSNP